MELDELLSFAVDQGVSDIHIKSGAPPLFRLHGELLRSNAPNLSDTETRDLVYSFLSEDEREEFEREQELDLSYIIPELARFRANCFVQRGTVGAVFRAISLEMPNLEDLGLPAQVQEFCDRPRGIIFVTGPAGSGKTTTQAAMVDYINRKYPYHILTVEDPVEFVHKDKLGMVNQRELRNDTHSFANAVKYSLREDPDVILIGEMRDLDTMSLAITAAETGHLVLGTLHTNDSIQTIDRVIDVFPAHQQHQIRMQLSVSLVGVISQLLLRRTDGNGMAPAFEVLVGTPAVRALIREGKTPQLFSALQTGTKQGMITLEQSLAGLVNDDLVALDDALARANDPEHLRELVENPKEAKPTQKQGEG